MTYSCRDAFSNITFSSLPLLFFFFKKKSDCSDLGNADLSGQLVPQLGQLKNLQYLYVLPLPFDVSIFLWLDFIINFFIVSVMKWCSLHRFCSWYHYVIIYDFILFLLISNFKLQCYTAITISLSIKGY